MRMLCLVVAAAVSSSGCSILKLTTVTGPGCCEALGESVAAQGPYTQRVVVRASVVQPHPDEADVRFACTLEQKPHHVEVTAKSIEYGASERVWLGLYAVGAGVLGTAMIFPAVYALGAPPSSSIELTASDVAIGTMGALLATDAVVTAGLAAFHPTMVYEQKRDAPAGWQAARGGCPRDLQVVVDGATYDVGPDLRVTGADAVALAEAVQRGAAVDVDDAGRRAALRFSIRPTRGAFVADAVAIVDR